MKAHELRAELIEALHAMSGEADATRDQVFWLAGIVCGTMLRLEHLVDQRDERIAQLEHALMMAAEKIK